MLKGITWGQFSIFMLVMTGLYYLYVFGRFYGTEVFGLLKRKTDGSAGSGGMVATEEGGESKGEQGELFEKEGAGGQDEQFRVMQRAISVIREVIAQGIENKLDRENLLDHIREVLGNYRQLRGTEYAETINNFLIRVCSAELSLAIGETELAILWK